MFGAAGGGTVPVTISAAISGVASNRSVTVSGAGCSPGSYTTPAPLNWTPGSSCSVSFTSPQSGGPGTQYVFTNWSDNLSTSNPRVFSVPASATTYTANFTAQYSLTTSVGAGGGGPINPSPGVGWWNSGYVVQVSASASSGHRFSGFSGSLGGTQTPKNLTMSGPINVMASFVPVPLTLPTSQLKGVHYFPQGHAWWSMLYDWYQLDCGSTSTQTSGCTPGAYVRDVVQTDLQKLKAAGFNFIHLYLWDQDSAEDALPYPSPTCKPASYPNPAPGPIASGSIQAGLCPGFTGWDDGGPSASPYNQWAAFKAS